MPAPSYYTEETLAAFLHATLAQTAAALDWSPASGSYREIVNETLLALGTDDLTTLTGTDALRRVRTIARRELWRAVVAATAADFNFKSDGSQFDRAAVHDHARAAFADAERDALPYDSLYIIRVGTVSHPQDPYIYLPEDER